MPWEAVTIEQTREALVINVQSTQGRSRILGWRKPGLLNYEFVGPDRFVRGKFYIYTDVSFFAPLNQVPNFRIGLMNEDAVRAMTHFELAATGASDPGYEPYYAHSNNPSVENYTNWLRPADSTISPTPSLYRIDFDPVDVPAAAGSSIGAFIESYTIADPANGSLFLTEIVLGTYNALNGSGDLEWSYHRENSLSNSGQPGGSKILYGGLLTMRRTWCLAICRICISGDLTLATTLRTMTKAAQG